MINKNLKNLVKIRKKLREFHKLKREIEKLGRAHNVYPMYYSHLISGQKVK